jgi:hypothetical protein
MSESSYDVYVHEGHIVEVHRGEHGTVAQIFGEDWNTQPMVNFHPAALAPIIASPAPPAPAFKPLVERNYLLWAAIGFGFAALFGLWLILR